MSRSADRSRRNGLPNEECERVKEQAGRADNGVDGKVDAKVVVYATFLDQTSKIDQYGLLRGFNKVER